MNLWDFNLSIPNKISEYLCYELPIISSLKGDSYDLIKKYNCGINYDVKNKSKFINDLKNLYLNNDFYNNLKKGAIEASNNFKEPVVLGNQLEGYLNSILNILSGMADDMSSAKTVKGHAIPRINKRGLQAKATIAALRRIINPNGPSQLKSKKVFTE